MAENEENTNENVSVEEVEDGAIDVTFYDTAEAGAVIDAREKLNLAEHINKSSGEKFLNPYSDDEINGKEYLKLIGAKVVKDFQDDKNSRGVWEERKARELELFSSYMPPKTKPWKDASNINLPFITTACLQFHARAYDALFPPRNICKALALGEEDKARADRVTDYMNYQLLYKMKEFMDDADKMLLQVAIVGSVFKKSFYDPVAKRNRSIRCSAADVVVNYKTSMSIEDCRVTHVIPMSRSEIRKRVKAGVFLKEAWDFTHGNKGTLDKATSFRLQEAIENIEGIEKGNVEGYEAEDRVLLEQHTEIDINGDGIDEPVVITVDMESEKVIRISPRFTTDIFNNPVVINYFTHYQFIPNPEGFYAFGFGTLLSGLNEGGNTIINEVVDSGALANMVGGFVSRRSGIKKGQINFEMGKFKEIDSYVDDIKKAIYTLDFKGPNNTLYSVLGLLFEYAKLVSSISETMTGQLPASDTPATTVLALLEEGRKVFSSIHRRMHRAFREELDKLYRLNSIYLNKAEYFQVLGLNNLPTEQQEQVGPEDFIFDATIFPVSDPTITSKAEDIIKAQEIKNEVFSNPLMARNEQAKFIATRNYLEVIDAPQIDDLLQPPPPPPNIPAEEENSMFIQEQAPIPLQEQDHLHHMTVHGTMEQTEFFNQMTPTAKQMLSKHNQQHLSMQYKAQNGGGEVGESEQQVQ